MDLRGKRVIVTGGAHGLGRSMVGRLVSRQAAVTVFDLDLQGCADLQTENPEVRCVQCDLSNHDQVVEATDRYHKEGGAADVLINNAGILYSAPLVRISESGVERHDAEAWNRVIQNDLSAVFFMTACVVAKMVAARTKGVVVNISSVSAAGNAGQSAYSAAKAGVNALTATWSKELGPLGIRVVAVAPGYADTESTAKALTEAALREVIRKVPLRRLGKPDEIADGVMSVIENDYFNGKIFELDGGLIL
jgi:3-oxoacyl-[acyl-carrier protein] reductase